MSDFNGNWKKVGDLETNAPTGGSCDDVFKVKQAPRISRASEYTAALCQPITLGWIAEHLGLTNAVDASTGGEGIILSSDTDIAQLSSGAYVNVENVTGVPADINVALKISSSENPNFTLIGADYNGKLWKYFNTEITTENFEGTWEAIEPDLSNYLQRQGVNSYFADTAMSEADINTVVLLGANNTFTFDSAIGEVGDVVSIAPWAQAPLDAVCYVDDSNSGSSVLVAVNDKLVSISAGDKLKIPVSGWVNFVKTAAGAWRGHAVGCSSATTTAPVTVEFVAATRTANWNINLGSYTDLPFDRVDKVTDITVIKQHDTDVTKFVAVVDGYYTGSVQVGLLGEVDIAVKLNGTVLTESERQIHQPAGESTISAVLFSGQLSAGDELQFSFKTPTSGTITAFSKLMFQRIRN
ncbi:MAG: hypothetical protein DRQ46_10825 [Gammaproteobacteria bacterium]|nr:MAG: hypothetical protein DRQ46_10825 [Gammaproteobacteria bacterium]